MGKESPGALALVSSLTQKLFSAGEPENLHLTLQAIPMHSKVGSHWGAGMLTSAFRSLTLVWSMDITSLISTNPEA